MLNFLFSLIKNIFFFIGAQGKTSYKEPLSESEENYYVEKLLNNKDQTARSILIEHNLRLVAHICKKNECDNESLDDFISIGTIGLIKAIDSYNLNKGVRIATYASKCIDNEILMHLRANKKHYKNISLNESIGLDKDGNEITLLDILPSNYASEIEVINQKEEIEKLQIYFNKLDKREKEILNLRYGLDGNKPLTQREVSKKFNISRSYVSRIEKRAFIKIYQEFKKST